MFGIYDLADDGYVHKEEIVTILHNLKPTHTVGVSSEEEVLASVKSKKIVAKRNRLASDAVDPDEELKSSMIDHTQATMHHKERAGSFELHPMENKGVGESVSMSGQATPRNDESNVDDRSVVYKSNHRLKWEVGKAAHADPHQSPESKKKAESPRSPNS